VTTQDVETEPNAADTSSEQEDRRPRVIAYDGPTTRSRAMRWVRAFVPLGLAVALSFGSRLAPAQVESVYSRGVYPKVAALLDGAGRWWGGRSDAPFGAGSGPSLSEALLAALLLLVGGFLLFSLSRGFGTFLRRSLWVVGTAALLFVGLWGLNHSREPLSYTIGVDTVEVAASDLDRVAAEMAEMLTAELDEPHEEFDRATLPERAADVWREALDREPRLGWQRDPMVVAPLLGNAIVSAGISGVFSPFSQEAHVASNLPEPDLLFTACHEIAHVQGWAREDEANYLAWRVASRSSDPAFRRAALIVALHQVLGALRKADPELLAQRSDELDPRIETEFRARARFWASERSHVVSRAATAVNDAYLRSQGQDGVASYGRMVDLLVTEWRTGGFGPTAQ
jgi:hypothetical protein